MDWKSIGKWALVVVVAVAVVIGGYFLFVEVFGPFTSKEERALTAEAEYRVAAAKYDFARSRYGASASGEKRKLEDEVLQSYAGVSRAYAQVALYRGLRSVDPGKPTSPDLPSIPALPGLPRPDEIPGLNPTPTPTYNNPGAIRFPPAK